MKLTILGLSAVYPSKTSPCSGYLLQHDDHNIMIDCGSGVLGNLQLQLDMRDVSDIIITHMHADHFFDLIPYRYALRYGFNGLGQSMPKLYLPPGGIEILNRVVAPFAGSEPFFAEVFNVLEFYPGNPLLIGDLRVNFLAVRHYIPTYGLSITGSRKFAYSSDSSLCPALRELASDADLFLCTVGRCLGVEIDYLWGHMLPNEAGKVAKEARAKRLMITHLWPECDCVLSKQSASEAFGREVELAEILQTYDI